MKLCIWTYHNGVNYYLTRNDAEVEALKLDIAKENWHDVVDDVAEDSKEWIGSQEQVDLYWDLMYDSAQEFFDVEQIKFYSEDKA